MRIFLFVCLLLCLQSNAQLSGPASQDIARNTEISDGDDQSSPIGVDLMAGDSKGVTVFPNPANDHIIVSLAGKPGDKREIRLVSSMGQHILQIPNLRENSYMLDVSRLTKGIYNIEVISKGHVSRNKWVKQ